MAADKIDNEKSVIQIGPRRWDAAGNGRLGQDGGFLGSAYVPFRVLDALAPIEKLAALTPPTGLTGDRLNLRHELFNAVDSYQRAIESSDTKVYDAAYQKAFGLITSTKTKKPFDLKNEPAKIREPYGMTQFGQVL